MKATMKNVCGVTAEVFGLAPDDLRRKTNQQHIVWARHLAMYIIRETTTASLPTIGRWFGGKHHTTVLHGIRKIERERRYDRNLEALITHLLSQFPEKSRTSSWPRPASWLLVEDPADIPLAPRELGPAD